MKLSARRFEYQSNTSGRELLMAVTASHTSTDKVLVCFQKGYSSLHENIRRTDSDLSISRSSDALPI